MRNKSENRLVPDPGFTWELFCIAAVFLGALTASAAFFILVLNNRTPGYPLLITGMVLLVLTLKLTPVLANRYRKRQRLAQQSAEALMKDDPRPPVLYLRSFKDDEMIARAIAFYSVEQEMKTVFFEIGPFIAMAEPDKQEPLDPGASRMRLPHDLWQDRVGAEMSRAALVIMRIGDSDGFWWELRQAPKRVDPKRLVLLIPAEDEKLYEDFRRKACEWLPCRLPEFKVRKRRFSASGGIVYFEPDWTPHLQKFKVQWVRQTFWNTFGAMLKVALRPVYEQLGVEWTKPRVQPSQLLYWLVIGLLILLLLYLAYATFNIFLTLLHFLERL